MRGILLAATVGFLAGLILAPAASNTIAFVFIMMAIFYGAYGAWACVVIIAFVLGVVAIVGYFVAKVLTERALLRHE